MSQAMPHDPAVVACRECDLLQRLPVASGQGRVRCRRCGYVLHREGRDVVQVPLALGFAALILFVLSNSFPLLEFGLQGKTDATYLLAGIRRLAEQQHLLLATMVLFTTVLAPVLHIGLLIHVYLPLALGRRPVALAPTLRLAQAIVPWSMLEIFLLGVLVASVKLAEDATIVYGPAAWSLGLLVIVLALASTQVHPSRLWERVA